MAACEKTKNLGHMIIYNFSIISPISIHFDLSRPHQKFDRLF